MVVGVFGPSVGNGECLLTVNSDTQSVLAAEKDGDKPGHRAHGHPAPSRLGLLHNTLAFAFQFDIAYRYLGLAHSSPWP